MWKLGKWPVFTTTDTLKASALEQDAELATIAALQQAFKGGNLRLVATAIIRAAIAAGGCIWPDDDNIMSTTKLLAGEDKNVVGTAYRWLGKANILERTEKRRRSESKASKGREVTMWRIRNWNLAKLFLRRNEENHIASQQEMFK